MREVEEYGRQHVFLYKTSKTQSLQLTNASYIRGQLAELGREDLMDKPPVLDRPDELTLADVRIEPVVGGNRVVVKTIERRSYRRFIDEEQHGNRITRTYEVIEDRAVNVARLHPDGMLEMRIQTHASNDYSEPIESFWSLVNPIIPQRQFQQLSVSPAKQYLWTHRKTLAQKIRYSDARFRNGAGTSLSAATGDAQASLYDDNEAAASLDTFSKGDAYCDKSNVFWLKQDNSPPSREVHTLLEGKINEFVVTATCTRADYEYVLNELKKANS